MAAKANVQFMSINEANMTIRNDLDSAIEKAKADLAALEANKTSLEAEANGFLDKDESEVKGLFSRLAAHFSWLTVSND